MALGVYFEQTQCVCIGPRPKPQNVFVDAGAVGWNGRPGGSYGRSLELGSRLGNLGAGAVLGSIKLPSVVRTLNRSSSSSIGFDTIDSSLRQWHQTVGTNVVHDDPIVLRFVIRVLVTDEFLVKKFERGGTIRIQFVDGCQRNPGSWPFTIRQCLLVLGKRFGRNIVQVGHVGGGDKQCRAAAPAAPAAASKQCTRRCQGQSTFASTLAFRNSMAFRQRNDKAIANQNIAKQKAKTKV
mmetsp:Transcript_16542/g.41465  ORF Transcript_16542/g.41465 Transcript_16542/m.41465 type:complete len:238 (+) Transcript_16542:1341-2054(+)